MTADPIFSDDPRQQNAGSREQEAFKGKYHPWSVEVVECEEGYCEFRCVPAHWTHIERRPIESLVAEGLSCLLVKDKDPDFWSASDAYMRVRSIAPQDLDVRELTIMSTRRTQDYNAPKPWASRVRVEEISTSWDAEHDPNLHPFANLPTDEEERLWEHYGMTTLALSQAHSYNVQVGYYISPSQRPRQITNRGTVA